MAKSQRQHIIGDSKEQVSCCCKTGVQEEYDAHLISEQTPHSNILMLLKSGIPIWKLTPQNTNRHITQR